MENSEYDGRINMICRSSTYTWFPGQVHTFPATEAMEAAQAAEIGWRYLLWLWGYWSTRCQVISPILYADLPAWLCRAAFWPSGFGKPVSRPWQAGFRQLLLAQLPFNAGQIQTFVVAPLQLGPVAADSVKGPSMIVYILDTGPAHIVLKGNCLTCCFVQEPGVGDPVGDWSMVHAIGMEKSSACRIILECTLQLGLDDPELLAFSEELKALLRMKATYEPSAPEEQQFMWSLGFKSQMSERSRPDPLMVACKWSDLLRAQGLNVAAAIGERIQAYNKGRTDAIAISHREKAFIKLYVHQAPESIQLLKYHWQNFKVAESAVPLKIWANRDLSPDTKQIRFGGKVLWTNILKWTPGKNYYWVLPGYWNFLEELERSPHGRQECILEKYGQQVSRKLQGSIGPWPGLSFRPFSFQTGSLMSQAPSWTIWLHCSARVTMAAAGAGHWIQTKRCDDRRPFLQRLMHGCKWINDDLIDGKPMMFDNGLRWLIVLRNGWQPTKNGQWQMTSNYLPKDRTIMKSHCSSFHFNGM